MHALLTAIALWLSTGFGLPPTDIMPDVEFVTAAEMATLRAQALQSELPGNRAVAALQMHPAQQQLVSIYDDSRRTIFLLEDWSDRTPAGESILVHEMVHHLQNMGGQRFECVQAREKVALEAQDRWLKNHGRSLQQDFDIDPFTQLASSLCIY